MGILIFISGVILGVAADRLWTRVEQLPQFKIWTTFFEDCLNNCCGITFHVRNVGRTDIPDYKLYLFHPDRGSLSFFETEDSGPLVPDQERSHAAPQLKNDQPDKRITSWFLNKRDESDGNIQYEKFEFRIVMERSDKVLFSSNVIGTESARQMVRVAQTGQAGRFSWEEAKRLETLEPYGLDKVRQRFLELTGIRKPDKKGCA